MLLPVPATRWWPLYFGATVVLVVACIDFWDARGLQRLMTVHWLTKRIGPRRTQLHRRVGRGHLYTGARSTACQHDRQYCQSHLRACNSIALHIFISSGEGLAVIDEEDSFEVIPTRRATLR